MRGEWIEIVPPAALKIKPACLSPCGESGLKSFEVCEVAGEDVSLPMRGEWIEIFLLRQVEQNLYVSPHAGRVD